MSELKVVDDVSKPALEVIELTKSFGRVSALRGATMRVRARRITAIVGDNGAGKSTLIKCISGIHKADSGEIRVHGRALNIATPQDAREAGVEVVYQDLALCDQQTVWQNLYLGRELTRRLGPFRWLDRSAMRRGAQAAVDAVLQNSPPASRSVLNLSGGQRQAVAMARAVMWARGLLILDEPTAALGARETGEAEDMIRRLVDDGATVLMISHDFEQVMRLATDIFAMRGGKVVGAVQAADTTIKDILAMVTTARA